MNKQKESVLFERRLIHLLAKWVVERLSFHRSIRHQDLRSTTLKTKFFQTISKLFVFVYFQSFYMMPFKYYDLLFVYIVRASKYYFNPF